VTALFGEKKRSHCCQNIDFLGEKNEKCRIKTFCLWVVHHLKANTILLLRLLVPSTISVKNTENVKSKHFICY
jgi:hypothetical protein